MTATAEKVPPEDTPRHDKQVEWRKRNPQAYWAHAALRSGLRRGLVTRQSCAFCGDANAEAHHPDYDRPLVVEWLCRVHHKARHTAEKRGAQE